MASLTFQDGQTLVPASWLNDVNNFTYNGVMPNTLATVLFPYKEGAATSTQRNITSKLQETVSAFDFMTAAQIADVQAGTLTLDVSGAIQNALNSGALVVNLAPYKHKLSSGITVPVGVSLVCVSGFLPSNGPAGCRLIFDLSVPTCVTMGGVNALNGSCSVKGFTIGRAAGTPPSGSIGLLNQNTNTTVIEDINSVSHQICAMFQGDKTVYGTTCSVNRLITGAAYDSHVVIDTMPEIRFHQCRFGMNGSGDQNCNSYVRIQGGSATNAANGPGTIVFSTSQFNQGVNSGNNWIAFQNQTPSAISDIELFQIDNCYIEDNVVGIFSDSSWTHNGVTNMLISNTLFNVPSATQQFMSLNAVTALNNFHMTNCNIKCAFTLNQTPTLNFIHVSNTEFLGNVNITGTTGSVINFSNNQYTGNLSLAGVLTGQITGGQLNGTYSNTTTGGILMVDNLVNRNAVTAFNLTPTWGGGSTGWTSTANGTYQLRDRLCTVQFQIIVTAKGSSTGSFVMAGLPFPRSGTAIAEGGNVVNFNGNMAGLTSPIIVNVNGSQQIAFFQQGATGVSALTDANFTSTTQMFGSFSYFI